MNQREYEKIREIISRSPDKTPEGISRWLLKGNIPIMYKIIEDWLRVLDPQYAEIYLNIIDYHGDHGGGPTKHQARVLRRMAEKGHTISTVYGRFKWTIGSDFPGIRRHTIAKMLNNAWIRYEKSESPKLDYEFVITEQGKLALETYDAEYE